MKSAILIAMLASMVVLVTMLPGGQCSDYVSDVNVTDITTSSARLVWQWSVDDDENNDPIGCTIVTRMVDKRMKVVHEVELNVTIFNYTVAENLTSWERYESCVRPLLLNGSLIGIAACSGFYVTDYNPWTQKTETAVIISAGLIFALLIAVAINTRWPRTTRRTFSMDEDEEDDEEEKQPSEVGGNINAAFYGDGDGDSVDVDWNKAANAAMNGGRTRGEIPWMKSSDTDQQTNTVVDDVNDNHSQQPNIHRQQSENNYAYQHDQPGMPDTELMNSQQPNQHGSKPDHVYVTRIGTDPQSGVHSQQPDLDRQQPNNIYATRIDSQQPESPYPNLPGTDPYAAAYNEAYGELPAGEGFDGQHNQRSGDPQNHGSGDPQYHGSGDPQYHGSGDPHYHGSGDPHYHGSGGQHYHGSGDPQYQGTGDQYYRDIPAQKQQHPYHAVYQNPDYHHYSTHVATIEGVDNGYF